MRVCTQRPFFFAFSFTRRSWSLRKQQSHLRCASRSTTAWVESLSRRWASLPRSALTVRGPRATFFPTSPTFWCGVFFYVFLFLFCFISMTHPLCNLPPHKNSILSFHLLSCITPSPKLESTTPRLLNTHPPAHTCTSCTPLITFNHILHTSMVTAAVAMEIFNKPQWVRLCFTFEMMTEILLTNYLFVIAFRGKIWSLLWGCTWYLGEKRVKRLKRKCRKTK